MIRHLAGIFWHVSGMFLLPFVLGFVAALFFEVSEVGETLPMLIGVSLVLILPAFIAQLLGLILKVRREVRMLREKGRLTTESALASVHRQARIVTPRGWAILFTGLWFVVCALGLKWADLSIVGVMCLMLFYSVVGVTSLMSTFMVGSFESGLRRRGSIDRQMVPAVVLQGEAAEERFIFRRVPVPPGFFLLVEDALPERLQTHSRYAVGAGARKEELIVGGRLRATPRGLYRLGPAEVYYQDMLGMTRVALASVATCELKVLPRFRNLEIIEPPRSKLSTPDVLTRPHRFPTDDYFRFREYAHGDDTRRISWKLSMKSGKLQVRQPETKEISTRTVLLCLDAYLGRANVGDAAVGIEEVLDRLVETWISLAKELLDRGDKVSLVAAVRQPDGTLAIEQVLGTKGGHTRWQDMGARAVWQSSFEITQLLEEAGDSAHGVVVSSRFHAPPPAAFAGQSLAWVWLPPEQALGATDASLLQTLAGTGGNALTWLFRQPFIAGADENAFLAQFRVYDYHARRLAARARLRAMARREGGRTLAALIARGDTVYRLEPGVGTHKLIGLVSGQAGGRAA